MEGADRRCSSKKTVTSSPTSPSTSAGSRLSNAWPLDRPVCSWSEVSDLEGTSQGDSEGVLGSGFRSAPEPLHL